TPRAVPAHSGVFQLLSKEKCTFINGSERVRYVEGQIYNREQQLHFDSDVGNFVEDTPFGEIQVRYWNSQPEYTEYMRPLPDNYCRHNYEGLTPFSVDR
ncbi:HB2L protein, partial [Atrichornis clamosus]|nr:HB2L protein [Atrichornis clamosus]